MWLRSVASSADAATADHQPWTPAPTPSGHFAPVSDLKVTAPALHANLCPRLFTLCQWSRDGSYLVSVSEDQTARTWARDLATAGGGGGWREVARPQVKRLLFGVSKCLVDLLP